MALVLAMPENDHVIDYITQFNSANNRVSHNQYKVDNVAMVGIKAFSSSTKSYLQ